MSIPLQFLSRKNRENTFQLDGISMHCNAMVISFDCSRFPNELINQYQASTSNVNFFTIANFNAINKLSVCTNIKFLSEFNTRICLDGACTTIRLQVMWSAAIASNRVSLVNPVFVASAWYQMNERIVCLLALFLFLFCFVCMCHTICVHWMTVIAMACQAVLKTTIYPILYWSVYYIFSFLFLPMNAIVYFDRCQCNFVTL